MSSRHHKHLGYSGGYDPCCCTGYGGFGGLFGGGGFNFSYILILLLIALQFGRRTGGFPVGGCTDGVVSDPGVGGFAGLFDGNRGLIDNSVLFLIAIYLLICGCGTGYGGGCGRRFC